MLFADVDGDTPATVWAVAMTGITTVGGIIMYVLRQRDKAEIRRQERQKTFREEVARMKAAELERKNKERQFEDARREEVEKERKKVYNEHFQRLKEFADIFKSERDIIQKQYEAKCVECMELKIKLEEARKGKIDA